METPVLDTMTAAELEAALLEEGAKLLEHRKRADAAVAAWDQAVTEWKLKPEIKALDEATDAANGAKVQSEARVRAMQERLYTLTGVKTPHPAFQMRVTPTPEYDNEQVMKWFTGLLTSLFDVKKPAFNAWVKDIVDDDGLLPPLGDHRIPAIIVNKATTTIISAGLEKLADAPKPVDEDTAPISVPVTINGQTVEMKAGDSLYVPSAEEIQAVIAGTSMEVAQQITKAFDDQFDRELMEASARLNALPQPAVLEPVKELDLSDIPF